MHEVAIAAEATEVRRGDLHAGAWEVEPARCTPGSLVCGTRLRAMARHTHGYEAPLRRLVLADELVAEVDAHGLHAEGHRQRTYDDGRRDAALLFRTLRGALPIDDPRSVATSERVLSGLTEDDYCYRFRPDERPLGEAAEARLLCGFWVALSFAGLGRRGEARGWFERNRAPGGPASLLSDEFDAGRRRRLRGNLAQAFFHALLPECAVRLGTGRGEES